jgi:hypothetical protein
MYLWGEPRVGRASWACNSPSYMPNYQDHANFAAWDFGPRWPERWDDVQFPTRDSTTWQQATSARYIECDTGANAELQSDATAIVADSEVVGKDIVYLKKLGGRFEGNGDDDKTNQWYYDI